VFNRLCLIGTGLIGGSIAKAARERGLVNSIVAYGPERNWPNLQRAQELGVIDTYSADIGAVAADADLVIIATPVGAIAQVCTLLKPYWRKECIYSDAGSTKGSVVEAVRSVFGHVPENFVPAHPIAGAERSGVEAAQADLYQNRRLIITPLDDTDPQAVDKLDAFWRGLGSSVSVMSVQHHDSVLAATSHLPHILAFALVAMLGRKDEQNEIFKYAAGGFKDFTRIASSDPTMWQDICVANHQELLPLLREYREQLLRIEHMLLEERPQALHEEFSYAKQARQRFLEVFDTSQV
jgi:prephenate dehydrogenase